MTLAEAGQCEYIAGVIMSYRDHLDFLTAPCWMDEWVMGYVCALRDIGIINAEQWAFLCDAFQPEDLK